ncbi:MAG: hypothetical protein HY908_19235, partial [Myxococcales bacterium]|nr:hypothetical protein [Myxococcales bacterium]
AARAATWEAERRTLELRAQSLDTALAQAREELDRASQRAARLEAELARRASGQRQAQAELAELEKSLAALTARARDGAAQPEE